MFSKYFLFGFEKVDEIYINMCECAFHFYVVYSKVLFQRQFYTFNSLIITSDINLKPGSP